MKLQERRGGRIAIGFLFGILGLFILARVATAIYVDVLWFQSMGYVDVYWKRALWSWGVRGSGMLAVALVLYVNLRIVARTLGGIRIKRRLGDLEISEQLPAGYISLAVVGISVLLGLWFGASIPQTTGLNLLFVLGAPEWGVADPILGKDLTFYALSLPLMVAGTTFAMVMVFLAFSLSAAGYAATGALRWDKRSVYVEEQSRKHLTVLVAVFFTLLAIRLFLGRYLLLLTGSSAVEGIFGFTDAHARLPSLRILTVLAAFTVVGTLWSGFKGRMLPFAVTFGSLIVGGVVAGQLYPAFVQRFRVEPNELDRETPYIEHAIDFTHMGYGLDGLERRTFDYVEDAPIDWFQASAQFSGLPVWSQDALLTTYREVEARRSYYDFNQVTIDRYPTADGLIPVALSVREVDPSGIDDPNWQNLHLRSTFVRGLGAVASAGAAKTAEGRPPMFLSDIPVRFDESGVAPEELRLTRPEIFIGSRPRSRMQPYAILNPGEHLSPDSVPGEPGVDFPAGIGLDTFVRKLALSWQLRDLNLFFASEVSPESRIVLHRQVIDRVRQISGDLVRFYESPYPVIVEGRVVWVLEGFVRSRWFPLGSTQVLPGRNQDVRYIRNSVKITVDALTGEVDYYVSDDSDPLLAAYRSGFPTLFQDLDAMPGDLREHLRYPRSLLQLQAEVLNRYHQEEVPVFHRQEELWASAQELARSTTAEPYRPEYGLLRLPGEEEPSFVLSTVFVPDGRQNLAALLVVRNDPGRLGELVLYEMPAGVQIPGPRQVEALVEQDPEISQQFSLWRTGGSEVWTGHLHLVPVGNTLIYMEPVFLAAEADAIPELSRFVVSDGRRVSMEPTLQSAIAALASGSGFSLPEGVTDERSTLPDLGLDLDPSRWPAEALGLLDEAEQRLREGDYRGFGEALDRLRALLSELSAVGGRGGAIP